MEGVNNKSSLFLYVILFLVLQNVKVQCDQNHIHSFIINPKEINPGKLNLQSHETKRSASEEKCEKEKENFADLTAKLNKGERLEEKYTFVNESKYNLALAWAGADDSGNLIVLTTKTSYITGHESTLWRSENHGRDWIDISDKVNNEVFRKDDGLQRNPHDPTKVYLVGHKHFIYVTEDGGKSWRKEDLVLDVKEKETFSVGEMLEFHTLSDYANYVAVISNERKLYVTYDNFQTAVKPVKRSVHMAKWGTQQNMEKSLYVTTGEYKDFFTTITGNDVEILTLERLDGHTGIWKTLLSRVVLFNVQGKFLYASIYKSESPKSKQDDRLMMISTDGGDTWKEARLPTLTKDRFYSVMDMSEDLIFMHVDNPGDTGQGTLYTSSSNGIFYSESLKNHLFPNYNNVHDFYKVKSLRGVYLASQMGSEQSIHTVITYTRGGEWKKVPRPKGSSCENNEEEGCSLQIHNAYSIHRGIKARLPHSIEKAYGLLLVHAHVAKNLQTTDPDVYLSNDGGYNFRKVLDGPHAYEIADSGGLLLAVSLTTNTPNIIKFSTDEGRCWHSYRFTNEQLRFTGLLTEPGGKSMTVSIWGYTVDTKKWTVNVIDFSKVVPHQCKDSDYETWTPHTALYKGTDHEGCLLGQRESFSRIKEGSWCRNGYNKHMERKLNLCTCTKDDYECDYGFYRPVGSDVCKRQSEIKADEIELCNGKNLETLITPGYRLIPGDKCTISDGKGFRPAASKEISFDAVCKRGQNTDMLHNEVVKVDGPNKLIIVSIIIGVVVLVGAVGAFVGYKWILLRRHKVVYRYSMLNQTEEGGDDFENALIRHDTLYNDTSDEEIEAENKSPDHHKAGAGVGGAGGSSSRMDAFHSFHDDSDDDMLG